jgi:hypothetical protein
VSRATEPVAVDFDLSGIVGVRLEAPTTADLRAARRSLGDPSGALTRMPDIHVRFATRLSPTGLCWVEPDGSGFSEDGYFVLRRGRRPARARISFDAPEGGWELLSESGRAAVPHLLPMVRLAALKHGWVPLHAAAFQVEGRGVIAAGWAHGGKTSALLAFMERGARYLADDWVLLSASGSRMRGIAGEMALSDAQLLRFPQVAAERGRGALLRRAAARSARLLPRLVPARARGGHAGRLAARLAGALERRAKRSLTPEELFGARLELAAPHVLFVMMRHEARDVRVEPIAPETAAARLASASGFEELPFLGHSLGYRFAFPERAGVAFVEHAAELRRRLLTDALAGVRAYLVRHPRAADSRALHAAMASALDGLP